MLRVPTPGGKVVVSTKRSKCRPWTGHPIHLERRRRRPNSLVAVGFHATFGPGEVGSLTAPLEILGANSLRTASHCAPPPGGYRGGSLSVTSHRPTLRLSSAFTILKMKDCSSTSESTPQPEVLGLPRWPRHIVGPLPGRIGDMVKTQSNGHVLHD